MRTKEELGFTADEFRVYYTFYKLIKQALDKADNNIFQLNKFLDLTGVYPDDLKYAKAIHEAILQSTIFHKKKWAIIQANKLSGFDVYLIPLTIYNHIINKLTVSKDRFEKEQAAKIKLLDTTSNS